MWQDTSLASDRKKLCHNGAKCFLEENSNFFKNFLAMLYRVFHSKDSKDLLLWVYRYWFLLVFWILRVHERGTFMPNWSVFIFLMLHALYRMICKNTKSFFGKNCLNVSNVKLFSIFFSTVLAFFMPFWWE